MREDLEAFLRLLKEEDGAARQTALHGLLQRTRDCDVAFAPLFLLEGAGPFEELALALPALHCTVTVGETDKEFSFNFKVENIKIIPGAYNVIISSKLLAEFTNSKMNLTYFIALEPDSTFG